MKNEYNNELQRNRLINLLGHAQANSMHGPAVGSPCPFICVLSVFSKFFPFVSFRLTYQILIDTTGPS